MSSQFTVYGIYPNKGEFNEKEYEGKVNISMYAKSDSVKTIDDGMFHDKLVGIPGSEVQKGKSYRKVAIECLSNMLQDFGQNLSKNCTNETMFELPNKQMSEECIPLELLHQVTALTQILQYIINSTSWNGKQYHAFDAVEIEKKLRNCMRGDWIQKLEAETRCKK